ncbi:hypothetical protein GeomeDRAFT_3259 [Geobacter metallireducens RCH3]|nr:hypothetical protein GeomeDRAFT_3259 [Geobacter metallireducens RCH3]
MVRTVNQGNLKVHTREPSEHTRVHSLLYPLINSRNILARHNATLNGINKLVSLAGLLRLHLDPDMAILTTTPGLTHKFTLDLDLFGHSFTIGNLRLTNISLYLELSHETVNNNFKMKLTHARDNSLTSFLISPNTERRVFTGKLLKTDAKLLLIGLGLRLNSNRNNRLRELDGLKNYRRVLRTEGITSRSVLKTYSGSYVTSKNFLYFFTLVCVHLQKSTDTLFFTLCGVIYVRSRIKDPRINPNKAELTDKGVSHNLEGQRRERFTVSSLTLNLGTGIGIYTLYGRNIHGRRKIFNNRVKEILNPFILE